MAQKKKDQSFAEKFESLKIQITETETSKIYVAQKSLIIGRKIVIEGDELNADNFDAKLFQNLISKKMVVKK